MIGKIQQFFDKRIRDGMSDKNPDHSRRAAQLATAALMIEMTRADFHVNHDEQRAIAETLQRHFGMSREETGELVQLAQLEADQSVSLYQFTTLVDKYFTPRQKTEVVEMLWRVAFADGHKDKHEEHLVRKIADLLHVSHTDFVRTRHTVEMEMKTG